MVTIYTDNDIRSLVDFGKVVPINVGVTVTSKSKYGNQNTTLTSSKSFRVSFLDPCIDTAYVTISDVVLDAKQYDVLASEINWTHEPFSIVT